MIINLELTWDRIQLYLQNCLQQVSCIRSTFTHHFSVSGERCTHSKDLFHTRFMLVLQNAVLVLLYLAGAMDAACGCAINDHTNIWLFNYSTTYPSNILIVSSLYRFDFSLFYGIFFWNLNVDIVFEYSTLPWAHKQLEAHAVNDGKFEGWKGLKCVPLSLSWCLAN